MPSAICTLFEGNYHHGLAALANSLYANGYRGDVYAGYRGALPGWCANAQDNSLTAWPGTKTLSVGNEFRIHFLPINTDYHFTNYKPDFMINLWDSVAKDADALCYFDPDIVIKCDWSFFEKWISHGVALVHEITANDMTANNPIRKEWQKVMENYGKQVTHHLTSYINAGFCGVSKNHIEFLKLWSSVINIATESYGFLPNKFQFSDRTQLFFAGDQDAFNIAAMFCESPLCEIGPEGMDLTYGGFTMSHAIGSPKPWQKQFLSSSLKGSPPSLADKTFWLYTKEPIPIFSETFIKKKHLCMKIASFLGRFYRKY